MFADLTPQFTDLARALEGGTALIAVMGLLYWGRGFLKEQSEASLKQQENHQLQIKELNKEAREHVVSIVQTFDRRMENMQGDFKDQLQGLSDDFKAYSQDTTRVLQELSNEIRSNRRGQIG